MMKIGIYGGSFNPVHNGHIELAKAVIDKLQLDKLLIVPVFASPFKDNCEINAAQRLKMCRLAFSSPKIEVCSVEFDRGGVSYTADTVNAIKESLGENEYFLILGSDQLIKFPDWIRSDEILSVATVCAALRSKSGEKERLEKFADEKIRTHGKAVIIDFTPVDISSQKIRELIKNGEDASEFLPEAVYSYIKKSGLYK